MSDHVHERIAFLGVGGMGMTPLAVFLAKAGFLIDGVDDHLEEINQGILEAHYIGLCRELDFSQGYDELVYSRAIREDDPRLQEARSLGIKTISRGEKLAEIVAGKRLVAVVGSHGKTTTTAMLIHALREKGVSFSYFLGGLFADSSVAPAHCDADSDWVVAEIDESDGTINLFSPEITVCLPVCWDHGAFYKQATDLYQTFRELFRRTTSKIILQKSTADFLSTAEVNAEVQLLPEDSISLLSEKTAGQMMSLVAHLDGKEHRADVRAVGAYNATNALLALMAVKSVEGSWHEDALVDFVGVHRRQELLAEDKQADIYIYQDYAHHPNEVKAFLSSMKEQFFSYQKVVIFQPHRYSRTAMFAKEFCHILQGEDAPFLLPVYPAAEEFEEAGAAKQILRYDEKGTIHYMEDESALFAALDKRRKGKTLYLFVGAGDIYKTALAYADRMQASTNEEAREQEWFFDLRKNASYQGRLRMHEPLANKVTFRLGGTARFYAEPEDETSLIQLWQVAQAAGVDTYVVGRGSNLLVPDGEFAGLVLRLRSRYWRHFEFLPNGEVFARAGAGLREISLQGSHFGYHDFSFMEGIPGCVGGAIRMNAGAMGGWMSQIVKAVTVLLPSGKVVTKTREELDFSYRRCGGLENGCVLSVTFASEQKEDPAVIKETIHAYAQKRKDSQPSEPSAGCMFKNPQTIPTGKLIDEQGLKGTTEGGVAVSPVHGNFFVNKGNASYADVVRLVKKIRQEVHQQKQIWLEPEVQILGKTWEEALSDEC